VVVRLGNVRAKVQVVGGRLANFWDLWCQVVAEVPVGGGGIGYEVEVDEVFGCIAEVVVEDWCWVDMLHLVEWRFLPLLLLAKNVDSVL
jgi:hypothetical protein